MHELSICRGIIAVASGALGRLPPPPPRVRSVEIRVGRLTGLVPETLGHFYALLTGEGPLAGSRLDVEEVPIRGGCPECGTSFEIDALSFTCPFCGSGMVELLSGRELEVVSLETEDAGDRALAEEGDGD